jgi:hypothetical protein
MENKIKNENTEENDFLNIIDETSKSLTDDSKGNEQLSAFLENNSNLDSEESEKTIEIISDTLESVEADFEDLQKTKKLGKSRSGWLKDKLDESLGKFKPELKEKFIGEIKKSLSEYNNDTIKYLSINDTSISESLQNNDFEGLNKSAIANDFETEIKKNSEIGSIIIEDNELIKFENIDKEIQAVKDYFEADFVSPKNLKFKKAVSTAAVIAQKKNLLSDKYKDKSPEEISLIVDRGVTTAKVMYQVGKNKLSALNGLEYIIDRNVSILNTVIVKTTTKYGEYFGGNVGAAIGSIFGPAGTVAGATIGAIVGKASGNAIGKLIGEGVKKVSKAVISGIKYVKDKVGNFIKEFNLFN